MKETEIREALSDIDNIIIEEDTDTHITILDEGGDFPKNITFRFEEKFTEDNLKDLIYISPKLKDFLDIDTIVSYLFSLDKNLFTTLELLCFMWDEEDYNWLYDKTKDEYALVIMDDGAIGRLWLEKNMCIIDVKNIFESTYEIIDEEVDINDKENFFMDRQYFFEDLNAGIIMTAIHELRHLMLDTNIILPEDIYPVELSEEEAVENYCRDIWGKKSCWCLTNNVTNINIKEIINEIKD